MADATAITSPSIDTKTSTPAGPLYAHKVTFDLADDYPTGGYPGFKASLEGAGMQKGLEIVALLEINWQGYNFRYDGANDKLVVEYFNYDAADGPRIEHANVALAKTDITMVVLAR